MYSDDRGRNVDEFLTLNCKVKTLFCCFLSAASSGCFCLFFCTDLVVCVGGGLELILL